MTTLETGRSIDLNGELSQEIKELGNLEKKVLTKEDADKFVEQFIARGRELREKMAVPEGDEKRIDEVISSLFANIRKSPNDYLEKDEDGNYQIKEEVLRDWMNSLPEDDFALMQKYEIE
jgi:hypothetical protein